MIQISWLFYLIFVWVVFSELGTTYYYLCFCVNIWGISSKVLFPDGSWVQDHIDHALDLIAWLPKYNWKKKKTTDSQPHILSYIVPKIILVIYDKLLESWRFKENEYLSYKVVKDKGGGPKYNDF